MELEHILYSPELLREQVPVGSLLPGVPLQQLKGATQELDIVDSLGHTHTPLQSHLVRAGLHHSHDLHISDIGGADIDAQILNVISGKTCQSSE